jgi:hypothetical protein
MGRQPPDDAWPPPVLPKPPRDVLDVEPGRLVVGVVVVVVVADTRVGVGVELVVRENRGFDQWLELLVRVQLEPEPPLPEERRG